MTEPTERSPELLIVDAMALVEAYRARRASGTGEPLERFLADHPSERSLLEEMLGGAPDDASPSPAVESEAISGPCMFGPFELKDVLGRGGMGTVHRAVDTRVPREVALKLIHPHLAHTEAYRARLRREARVVSQLDHEHLCRLLEFGEEEGTLYLAMQLVRGRSLAERIAEARAGTEALLPTSPGAGDARSGPRLPRRAEVQDVVLLIEKIARALHYAHERGLVHRDVKPGNVMVTDRGEPIVLDFGLARGETDPALTRSGQELGTPLYLAPEQVRDEGCTAGPRTDVYALGVTLYECLTLRRPFEAPKLRDLLDRIVRAPPEDPRDLNPHVPRDLASVLGVALDKDPGRRYVTALDFAEDLRRIRDREPIRAEPPSLWLRAKRWVERNPTVTALGLMVMLLLGGAVGVMNLLLDVEVERAQRSLKELDIERRSQAESAYRLGAKAASYGDWNSALRSYDEAERLGHERPVALCIGRVEALSGAFRTEELAAALRELETLPVPPRDRARVKLLLGDFAPGRLEDPGPSRDLIREAIALGLDPADEAYARALLADDVPELRRQLEAALRIDPSHRRANEMSCLLLMFHGDDESALFVARLKALYPGDVRGAVASLLLGARLQQPERVEEELSNVEDALGASAAAQFRLLAEFVGAAYDEPSLERVYLPGGRPTDPAVLSRLLRAVAFVGAVREEPDATLWMNVPPALVQYFRTVIGVHIELAESRESFWQRMMWRASAVRLAKACLGCEPLGLDEALERSPGDATLLALRGLKHFVAQRWNDAYGDLLAASRHRAIPFVPHALVLTAGAHAAMAAWAIERTQTQSEAIARARPLLDLLLDEDDTSLFLWDQASVVLSRCDDDLLALHASRGRVRFGDATEVLVAEALHAYRLGALDRTIERCDEILRRGPHAWVGDLREGAIARRDGVEDERSAWFDRTGPLRPPTERR